MKKDIRERLLQKRNNHPEEELVKKSRKIKERLFLTGEYIQAENILFYVSKGKEVRTEEVIKESIGRKRVLIPVTDTEKHTITPVEIENYDEDLAPGNFSILEPKEDIREEFPLEDIDTVIVPGIAFDRRGNRVGYGKGYYDKLLSQMTDVMTIGLAYRFQLVERIPAEKHDVAVKKIITEKETIDCEIKWF